MTMFSFSPTRQGRRFSLSLPLKIWFRGRVEEQPPSRQRTIVVEDTFTKNISAKGCYFFLSLKPAVGMTAEMEITVPVLWTGARESKIRCWGKIVRVEDECDSERVGVAYTIERYQIAPVPEDYRAANCFQPKTEN